MSRTRDSSTNFSNLGDLSRYDPLNVYYENRIQVTANTTFVVPPNTKAVKFTAVGGGENGSLSVSGAGAGYFEKTFYGPFAGLTTSFQLTIAATGGNTILADSAGNTIATAFGASAGVGGTASGGDINSNGSPGGTSPGCGGASGGPFGNSVYNPTYAGRWVYFKESLINQNIINQVEARYNIETGNTFPIAFQPSANPGTVSSTLTFGGGIYKQVSPFLSADKAYAGLLTNGSTGRGASPGTPSLPGNPGGWGGDGGVGGSGAAGPPSTPGSPGGVGGFGGNGGTGGSIGGAGGAGGFGGNGGNGGNGVEGPATYITWGAPGGSGGFGGRGGDGGTAASWPPGGNSGYGGSGGAGGFGGGGGAGAPGTPSSGVGGSGGPGGFGGGGGRAGSGPPSGGNGGGGAGGAGAIIIEWTTKEPSKVGA